MAGGTWNEQNKILPGVYINFKAAPSTQYEVGERGIVTLCKPLSWGAVAQVIQINAGEGTMETLGYDVNTAPELLFLRELFRGTNRSAGAKIVLLYRPAADGAAPAAASIGAAESLLTVTARDPGTRGNDIAVSATPDPDSNGLFVVQTSVSGTSVDGQAVRDWAELSDNTWVRFSGAGVPTACTATALSGGSDGTVAAAAYSAYLSVIEPYRFDVIAYDGLESTVAAAYAGFVNRLRAHEGRKCQAVLSGYAQADDEGVINVLNGVTLAGGVGLAPAQTTWWVAGATAGATYSQSLTYAAHPLAVDVSPRYSNAQMETFISGGNFVLMEEYGAVKVVTDRNTRTTISADQSKAFSKNKVIRALDAIANDIYNTFSKYHIGQTNNDNVGRDLLKKEIVGYINRMQSNQGVQNFTADDVSVLPGTDMDAVVVELAVQPVDVTEKIYMTVTVS